MIDLPTSADDAPEFLSRISGLMSGVLQTVRPAQVYVSRVDQWFGVKWLSFSYKLLGAVGIWQKRITLPPFHPRRISWQIHFQKDDAGEYVRDEEGIRLAVRQSSQRNAKRLVAATPLRSSAMFWFSGATKALGRGSLMVYYCTPTERPSFSVVQNWYVEFETDKQWKPVRRKMIGQRELDAFEDLGAKALTPQSR